MTDDRLINHKGGPVPLTRRRKAPRACLVENRPHVRSFLADILEDLGFVVRECAAPQTGQMLADFQPDLIVLGPLGNESEVFAMLHGLTARAFAGKVMLFGGRSSPALMQAQEWAEQLGLTMVPPLGTPFRDESLKDNLSAFLPIDPPPTVPVDVEQALANDWLELWYQPKVQTRSLTVGGAEALIRMRHPLWGIVLPAYFIPAADDPFHRKLTEFVIKRVVADRALFAAQATPVELSINLPLAALEDSASFERLVAQLPRFAALKGLLVEIECAEAVADLPLVRQIATRLAFHDVGVAIDNIGPEGASLSEHSGLPFAEFKAARQYVDGCADDRLKRAVCSEIVAIAKAARARSVAVGIERPADFEMAAGLGVDRMQGFMLAKPMTADKFMRTILARQRARA
jgi:EAL domain-containing protein (putative c-di-GMP-specific phosphodiesterase class I)